MSKRRRITSDPVKKTKKYIPPARKDITPIHRGVPVSSIPENIIPALIRPKTRPAQAKTIKTVEAVDKNL